MGKPRRDLTIEEQLARGPMDLPFLMLVLLLLGIGLVMVFSASYASAYYQDGDPFAYISRQAVFGVAGIAVLYLVSKINYQSFRWLAVFLLIAAFALLILVAIPGVGVVHNNARRWLRIFIVAGPEFQPSEVAKLAVILYFASRLSKRNTEKKKKWDSRTPAGRILGALDRSGFLELVPYAAILLGVAFLMYLEPHMSGTILIIGGRGGHPVRRRREALLVRGGRRGHGGAAVVHHHQHRVYDRPHRPVAEPLAGRQRQGLPGHPVPAGHRLGRAAGSGIWATAGRNSSICPSRRTTLCSLSCVRRWALSAPPWC